MGTMRAAKELMHSNMLVKHYAGSHAYGTSLPTSDIDFRGIFCADPVNIRTPFFPIRESEDLDEEDTKYYELSHFMKLCIECNPNIVETLWVDESDIVYSTKAYTMLRNERYRLLSSKIAFTTSGYAISQLQRMKGHHRWIVNPQPKEPPRPYTFLSLVQWFGQEKNFHPNFTLFRHNYRLVPYGNEIYGIYPWVGRQLWDDDGNLNVIFDEDHSISMLSHPIMIVKWNKEVYKQAKEKHTQYWTWKRERNKVRSKLEEEHGFDAKHAMHLVRLMRMGLEALQQGEIIVKRPDAEELIAIRNGAWTYEQILEYADHMDREIREVWYNKTKLPKKPDIKFASRLLMNVQDEIWNNQEIYTKPGDF